MPPPIALQSLKMIRIQINRFVVIAFVVVVVVFVVFAVIVAFIVFAVIIVFVVVSFCNCY